MSSTTRVNLRLKLMSTVFRDIMLPMALYPKRQNSSEPLLREPQVLDKIKAAGIYLMALQN
jgi:hypothetical protein